MNWIVASVVIGIGIWLYQKHRRRRSQQHHQLLEQIRCRPIKTHWEAWEDDYMGRD